ncbi:MAG: FkbM family methyltransferase [Desulfuromonadales bacterium]|nr:FkbM family methyltransferase [Desulfuromonadales bacterium]
MRGWRLKWAVRKLSSIQNFKKQRSLLLNPFAYYAAIFLKFVPGVYKRTIEFKLKSGTSFFVREFMTIYIYQEIFVDKCYDEAIGNSLEISIIDVGANTGMFALRAKEIAPKAQIICFEPFPPNYDQLKANLEINSLTGVTPMRKGVGGKSGKTRLYVHPTNVGGHSVHAGLSGDKFIEIELVDLASALSYTPGGKCDLLKLDCEGAEYQIIKSLSLDIARKIKRIIFEPTYSIGSPDELGHHLQDLGYSVVKKSGLFFATRESSGL